MINTGKGRFHIYTGDGKGKTTAALGLLIRYLGRGGKARLIQFDKTASDQGELHGERNILKTLPNLDFTPTGLNRFDAEAKTFRFQNEEDDSQEAKRGLDLVHAAFHGDYGLIVLDEVLSLVLTKLGSREDIIALVDAWEHSGRKAELVMTGHITWKELVDRADLVTQMRKVKHYYDEKHEARINIDY